MARKLHELTDDEISALGPDQLAELMNAEGAGDDTANANGEGNDDNPEVIVDEPNPVLNEQDDKVADVPLVDAKKDDADDLDDDAANADPAKKAVDAPVVDAGKKVDAPAKVDDKAGEPAKVDYEAEHKELLAPFKANGREIQVANVGEARQLMQMGANYNKKMQAMKPHLATLRTLENAKIGEAELNFLIDVHNRNPEAINKLVQDSGIDPLDLSADKAADYKPTNHKASDNEVELEAVLSDLDGSEGLQKTVEIVSQKWDVKSKSIVAQNPYLLKVINGQVESGIYDLVAAEVERRKTFGQLAGLSDFDAYRQVGDEMNGEGKFAHIDGSSTKGQQTPVAQVIEAPDPKKADDDKRKEQKRGAAPAKAATPAAKNPDFNPLSMSDEDFAKLSIKT